MAKKPTPTTVFSSNTLKNKLGLLKNPNPKFSADSFVPICSSCVFDSDMEEVKLYDKEEKDVMMKRWSTKELKEGIELKINLLGFGKDDIKVTIEGTSLFITTLLGKEEDDVLIVGPDVNEDDMSTFITEMKNGLLKISIPKKVEDKNVILVKVE
ncbi:hypothetical protein MKX03_022632 [Papaver bracteatum]|nr:hypothetical protein MKX03_022632 [Papaver bracteatum]